MKNFLITFGQGHVHIKNDKTFDHNCIARIKGENADEARLKAFDTFGPKWCFFYRENEYLSNFKEGEILMTYPRGIIDVD